MDRNTSNDNIRIISDETFVDLEETIEIDDIFDEDVTAEKTRVFRKEDIVGPEGESGEGEEGQGYAPDEEEPEFIDIEREKKHHRKHNVFLSGGIMVLLMIASIVVMLSPFFRINKITVEGNKYYTDKQVINMSGAETGGNIFLDANKAGIKEALMEDPYFKRVQVRRSLPGTLVIKVVEKEELAALKYGDRFVVLDSDYGVLRIAEIDPEVTIVEGLTITKMDVGREIEVEETKVMKDTIDTLDAMTEGDFFFKHIIVSKSEIKAYIYDMLLVDGTAKQLRTSIEEGRLQKVVSKLMKDDISRGTINLGPKGYISYSPSV